MERDRPHRATDGGRPSTWRSESVDKMGRAPANVAPAAKAPETDPSADVHLWDSWLLRDRYGGVATVDGWQVLFSLTADSDLLPEARHDVAEIRYFCSRNGQDWEPGGTLFEGAALGQRQWSGAAVYDDDALVVFYTATGDERASEPTPDQRIAAAHGGVIESSADTITLEGPWTHEQLLEPDGDHYQTRDRSRELTYAFRDPFLFEDPAGDDLYMLFEANTPVSEESNPCAGTPQQQHYSGAVGIARSVGGSLLEWELLPPLFEAVCVNHELERPHIVSREGRFYLFFSTHRHMFAPRTLWVRRTLRVHRRQPLGKLPATQ